MNNALVNWCVDGQYMGDQQKREQEWCTVQMFNYSFFAVTLRQL